MKQTYTYRWSTPDPVRLAANPWEGVIHTSDLFFLFNGTKYNPLHFLRSWLTCDWLGPGPQCFIYLQLAQQHRARARDRSDRIRLDVIHTFLYP
jgi:hypothetical protein